MARRGSKKGANPTQLIMGGIILVLLLVIYLFTTNRHEGEDGRLSLQDFPIEDYLSRGSILRDNRYTLRGRVEERFPAAKGEMISLAVKTKGRDKQLIPLFVPSASKSMNIERDQEYAFTVRVKNVNQELGIIMTESISSSED
jgi:hypothetical protein